MFDLLVIKLSMFFIFLFTMLSISYLIFILLSNKIIGIFYKYLNNIFLKY